MVRVLLVFGALAFLLSACNSTRKITYFDNVGDKDFASVSNENQFPLQPNNILSITISSLNPEATKIFNIQDNNNRSSTVTGGSAESAGYLINPDGFIQLPVLGMVKAAGLTKQQLKENITNMILKQKLLIEPLVDIRFLNFEVTVIGEVGKPTVITVPSEKISLLKALGLAGDLTIYGKRENVLLIREENGEKKTRHINLNSPNFFSSPYYYLQPNDVVYVEPNKTKIAEAGRTKQLIPILLSSLSIIVIVMDRLVRQ